MARTFRVSEVAPPTAELPHITAREQLTQLGWSEVEAFAIGAEHVLWLYDEPLVSLEGIEYVRGLVQLAISSCKQLTSIAHVAGLLLARLEVSESPIENIDAIANMRSLTELDLTKCTRLGPIGHATLPQLEVLCLMDTSQLALADFLPIATMDKLEYLVLWRCQALPEHLRCAHHGIEAVARARAEIARLAS